MKSDRDALTATAWAYPCAGLVIALSFLVAGEGVRAALMAATMLAVVPAGIVAHRIHGFPRAFTWGLAGVGALYTAEAAAAELVTVNPVLPVEDAIDLVATIFIIGLILFLVNRQRGGLRSGDLLDGIIIGAGAWLVSWVLLVEPYVDELDVSVLGIVLNAMYVPTTVVVLTISAVMLFGGGRPRPAVVLLVTGLLCNVGGDVLYALEETRGLGTWAFTGADMLYTLSVAVCGGAFFHPSARALIGASPARRTFALPGRLLLLVASLIAPVMLLASTPPSSTLDRWVRAASALSLLVLVGVRLYGATRAQLESQRRLELLSRTDELTSLPNKRALVEATDDSIDKLWRSDARPSLYLYDLDAFKNINDSFGHTVGDEVLNVIARRLTAASNAIGATVHRSSGDEFVVFDPSPTSAEQAIENARAIHLAFEQSLSTTTGELFVKASCGVACMPAGSPTSSEELFRWADIAMYRAKAAGRNRVVLYESPMQDGVSMRMDIENALHGVLERKELRLFHQPIIDIATGKVTGVEALLRWRRPDGSMLLPQEFIGIAEENGMIDEIGSWAIDESLRQLRCWIDDGIVAGHTTISVNVSPRQLADPRFTGAVSEALERNSMSPHLLWLEVTESVMVDNPEVASAALEQIRSTGVRIALDDFGTGYSSLSLLQQFPIQRIKIDRAFISSVVENLNDRMLVRTIIGLGESMGIDVVAEGVDSMLQLTLLRELGCAKAQGYLISRPAPAEAMRSTIAALDSLSQWPEFSQLMGDSSVDKR